MNVATTTESKVKTGENRPGRNSQHAQTLADMGRGDRTYSSGYSRFVSVAKMVLPLIALIIITAVLIWPHMKVTDNSFRIGFASIKTTEGEEPSMHNARYFGADDKKQPYSVTADLATALGEGVQAVELEMPKADIALEDGTWLVLTAKNGVYERSTEIIDLTGAVNLFHDTGYEFHTEKARLNLAAGTAEGHVPVDGQGPFGALKAEGFKLYDKGKRIEFTGKASLKLYPGAAKEGPQ